MPWQTSRFALVFDILFCHARETEVIGLPGVLKRGQGKSSLILLVIEAAHVCKARMSERPFDRLSVFGLSPHAFVVLLSVFGATPVLKSRDPPRIAGHCLVRSRFYLFGRLNCHYELKEGMRHNELWHDPNPNPNHRYTEE